MTITRTRPSKAPVKLVAAIYLRISDDREGKAAGVGRQEKAARAVAARLGAEVVHVYCDNDIGASTLSTKPRKDYPQMIADAKAGMFNVIIAYSDSRVTRTPRENEDLIDLAKHYGISFHYDKSPRYDLNTADGREAARTAAARNAGESERTGERVRAARCERQTETGWGGGPRPYGWGVVIGEDPRTGDPVIDYTRVVEAEANIIRECVDAFLSGVKLAAICRDLNERGIPTATGRGAWTAEKLRPILLRKRNCGIIVYDGEEVGRMGGDPIVPEEKFRALVDGLTASGRRTNLGATPRWLLAGIAQCWCGTGVTAHIQTVRLAAYLERWHPPLRWAPPAPVYRCRSGLGGHVRCNAAELDDGAVTEVLRLLARPDAADLIATAPGVDTAALRLEIKNLRDRKNAAASLFAAGKLDAEQVAVVTGDLREALSVAESALDAASAVSPLAPLVGLDAGELAERWARMPLANRREVIKVLMRITIEKTGKARFGPA
jgi:DNA invertase Pin-like site-specific DNA recombinase